MKREHSRVEQVEATVSIIYQTVVLMLMFKKVSMMMISFMI
jgi:hypothetical protein